IEAKWLFGLRAEQIDVIVHPQSIVHSLVQFEDGSMKAQMGLPDMKLPIQFALTYPNRFKTEFERFNFMDYPNLTFESPNRKVFKNLDLAYRAMNENGTIACTLNAANEVAVDAFLNKKISFVEIAELNENVVNLCANKLNPSYDDYVSADYVARQKTLELIGK
ncbi:MAG: 1-deoxy-D-xylulose-5-phosphate reductoisomerase, partial [Crocinitomicaceae bacterium]